MTFAHSYRTPPPRLGNGRSVIVLGASDPKLGGKMDFAGMNEGFKMFFGTSDNPGTVARSAVQVAALAGPAFLVEIEATAAKAPGK